MTTANSTLLGLALPVEGELDGTWGDVVNNAITQYLDVSIAGTQTLSANADATLVQTFGTDLATNIGATTAQYAVIRWTASNGATTRNINVPNSSKTYVVINDGTGSIVLRGVTGPTTGITIVSGEKCVAAWNGSDFVKISTSTAGTVTAVSVASANGFAGTSSGGATPALTLSTSITGVLKGNATAISAAIAGTDYVTPTGSETLTNKTLTNPTVTNYVESVVAIGTVTSAHTLVLTSGTVQTATLTASTACTFTMPTATAGKSFILLLKQAASTGNGTATFTGVKYNAAGTPVVTATAGKMDIFSFVADGTNWYGSISQGYTP
jgi:hypothetical protein